MNDREKPFELNFFRSRQIGADEHILTVESGEWCIVSSGELSQIKKDFSAVDEELHKKLLACHVILSAENRREYVRQLGIRRKEVLTPPSLHIVVVTPQCNLRCIYCHAAMQQHEKGHMTRETASRVLEKILSTPGDAGVLEIQGGEPLLNFDVVKFLVTEGRARAEKEQKYLDFSIVTNFTDLLTEEKIRFLVQNNVQVSTSIDGPEEVHEDNRNRVFPNGFAVLKDRISLFRQIWKECRDDAPQLSAMLTATKKVLDKPEETVDTFLELGFTDFFARPVNPLGRGERNIPELEYSAEDFVSFWSRLIDYIIDCRKRGVMAGETHLDLLLRKIFFRDNGYMDLRFPCGASYGQRTYNFDGKIYTCDEGRMVREQQFCIGSLDSADHELNRSPNGRNTFLASISELYYCEFCAYKPFCGVCPILNFKQTGNMVTSIYNSRRCKIYRGMLDYVFHKFLTDRDARNIFSDMVLEGLEE